MNALPASVPKGEEKGVWDERPETALAGLRLSRCCNFGLHERFGYTSYNVDCKEEDYAVGYWHELPEKYQHWLVEEERFRK